MKDEDFNFDLAVATWTIDGTGKLRSNGDHIRWIDIPVQFRDKLCDAIIQRDLKNYQKAKDICNVDFAG